VARLSVSIVTYQSDLADLRKTIHSLDAACGAALAHGLTGCDVWVVDNGPSGADRDQLKAALDDLRPAHLSLHFLASPANVGYGAANNLAAAQSSAEYHLILNPDVILAEDAIAESLKFMNAHPDCALLSPRAVNANGDIQYIAKRPPGVLTLLARAIPGVPQRLRSLLGNSRYEMRDLPVESPYLGSFLAGGCYMWVRRQAFADAGGFDPAYFMYFEDFDLSQRLARTGSLALCPQVRIIHHGGHAARKGLRHILWFIRSGVLFMNRHGWRWVA